MPVDGQDGAVVLAPRVVVLGEVIELRHRGVRWTPIVRQPEPSSKV
jgi:hypothetical protein